MKYLPEHLVDACLAELNDGADLESVLAMHPDEADALRPILAAAAWVRVDIPVPTRRLMGKQVFMTAVAQRRREVEQTQGYVNELKAGEPIEAILRRADPAIQPLVVAAWRMHMTPAPRPDAEKLADGKARLMALAERKRAERRASQSVTWRLRAGASGLLMGLAPRPSMMRRAWSGAAASAAAVIVLAAGVAGVTTAAADSLPGDRFYEAKRLGESARLLFAFDPASRAELDAELAAVRLEEITRLLDVGRPISAPMLRAWLDGRVDAVGEIERLPEGAQRQLSDAVSALIEEGVAVADLAGDPTLARDFERWLAQMAGGAASTHATESTPVVPLLNTAPRPVERPLPADDRPTRPGAAPAEVPAPRVAWPAPVPPPVDADADAPAGQVVQPGLVADEEEDEDENRGTGFSGGPGAGATPTAPQIIQVPPLEDPTATPTPATAPSGGDPSVPSPEPPPSGTQDPGSDPGQMPHPPS